MLYTTYRSGNDRLDGWWLDFLELLLKCFFCFSEDSFSLRIFFCLDNILETVDTIMEHGSLETHGIVSTNHSRYFPKESRKSCSENTLCRSIQSEFSDFIYHSLNSFSSTGNNYRFCISYSSQNFARFLHSLCPTTRSGKA